MIYYFATINRRILHTCDFCKKQKKWDELATHESMSWDYAPVSTVCEECFHKEFGKK